jgi:hypothetical protein
MAFLVPLTQYFLYFMIIDWSNAPLIWSTPLWAGATVTTGVFSLLMSYALIKPTNQGLDSILFRLDIL